MVDGVDTAVLGLVWAIMFRFMKIGDSEEGDQLNATDALLLWVKQKTAEYPNVSVKKDFKSTFADGLALCALYVLCFITFIIRANDAV